MDKRQPHARPDTDDTIGEWWDRLDPALHGLSKVVAWAATVYIAAVVLATAWGCR